MSEETQVIQPSDTPTDVGAEGKVPEPTATEQPTETTEPTEPTESTEPTKPTQPTDIEETLKDKGLDYTELLQEYADKGDLTAETREKLAKVGFDEAFVNDFIEGKKAIVEQQIAKEQAELAETVGGKENFDNIIQWAANNLTQEEKEAIGSVKNMAAQKLMLAGLKHQMESKEGKLPTFIQGGGDKTTEDIFESQEQMFEAIRDKRYLTDPAYQNKVTNKIRASRKAGINLGI